MASKSSKSSSPKKTPAKAVEKAPAKTVSTPVRNTAIPKVAKTAAPAPKVITHDMIAARAAQIWASGQGGSDLENWLKAEAELKA